MLTPPTETPLLGPTRNDARATSAGARAHARTNDTKRYTFKTLIGSGGLGDVWLAYDHRLGRDVAVKLSALEHRPETLARFAAEAHIQSSLDHRGIVPVLDVGTDPSGRPYIAMALIEGESLERVRVRCARDAAYALRWPRARMLRVFVDLCGALDHAHTRGVVHCDIKPANVVVSHDGEVFVIDWGIARRLHERDRRSNQGAILGSPGFMAPEQLSGRTGVTSRTDVYALGCTLYELLTGKPLVNTSNGFAAWAGQVLSGVDARPSRLVADLPPELDEICVRATAVAPSDRYEDVAALGAAVQSVIAASA
jgi:serine/threonine protein kinase